ncbi:hypothetical protein IIY68_01690 [Candidatus Saccharibacteria bacterium]|nr:hypothetical protein [Candidatus Saccharibacteria bacterium]
MKRTPELSSSGEGESKKEQDSSAVRNKRLGGAALVTDKGDVDRGFGSEVLDETSRAVDQVHDHFLEDISPKEHFERDFGPNPLETEEDYREVFDLFLQEELVPEYHNNRGGNYSLRLTYRPYKETVRTYLGKTREVIEDLAGESGKLPETDVAIYLDKSARPVSWFVNEFWEDFTDKPKPQTEHLAIDRRFWFEFFGVELVSGEYLKENREQLATWRDLPIHNVKQDEMRELWKLLKDEVITHEELDAILRGSSDVDNRIIGRAIDAVIKERGDMATQAEVDSCVKEGRARTKILNDKERLKNIYDACMIAVRLRGLFVPGGLSEEDLKNPERIMDYSVGMEGKNITIIDEVARTGTTREIAKHFIEWAFPEAASVNFYVFFEAKKLHDANSPMNGQMLMIPFWYSLVHDDGTGRGISGPDKVTYKEKYRQQPNNSNWAAAFGSDFLGVPIAYEMEKDKKSLRLREQITRLRVEYEKGHIS